MLDFVNEYKETSTTALSANPAVVVPLLTINGWILMMRKVTGGSVTFNQSWAAYRDGFGSATGNDNYWLGLDKVYHLMQLGSTRLRVEVRCLSIFCCLVFLTIKPIYSACVIIIICITDELTDTNFSR